MSGMLDVVIFVTAVVDPPRVCLVVRRHAARTRVCPRGLKSDERVETKRRLARMAEEQAEAQLAYRLEAVRVIVDYLPSLCTHAGIHSIPTGGRSQAHT